MLSGRVSSPKDSNGYYFVDRNPKYFEPILDYLRTGEWSCPPYLSEEHLLKEADFYMIGECVKASKEQCSDLALDEIIQSVLKKRSDTFYNQELKLYKETWEKLEKIITRSFWNRAYQGRRDLESPLFITKETHEDLLKHFKNSSIGIQLQNLKLEDSTGISEEFVVSYPCYVLVKTNYHEQGFLTYMKKKTRAFIENA